MADYLHRWESNWRSLTGGAPSGYADGDSLASVLTDVVHSERFGGMCEEWLLEFYCETELLIVRDGS